jgi:hypothetical protein
MINNDIEYLDGEIVVSEEVPTTVAECVKIFGDQLLVDLAVGNAYYRNKYPRVYRKASKELESVVPKAVKEEKTLSDGVVKKVFESEMDHLRNCYKQNSKLTEDTITKLAQTEPLFVKGERQGGGGRISQGALDAANQFFAEGDDVVEAKVQFIETMVPGFKAGRDADGNLTPESVARAIQMLESHLKREAKRKAKAGLDSAAPQQFHSVA